MTKSDPNLTAPTRTAKTVGRKTQRMPLRAIWNWIAPPRARPKVFSGCRWPVERDGRIEFCGALRARGIYCAEHAAHAEPEPETRPLHMSNQKIGRR